MMTELTISKVARAHYQGERKNLFDLQRGVVVHHLVNDPKSEQHLPKRASFCPEE